MKLAITFLRTLLLLSSLLALPAPGAIFSTYLRTNRLGDGDLFLVDSASNSVFLTRTVTYSNLVHNVATGTQFSNAVAGVLNGTNTLNTITNIVNGAAISASTNTIDVQNTDGTITITTNSPTLRTLAVNPSAVTFTNGPMVYVNTNGNDATAAVGDPTHPYRTLAAAVPAIPNHGAMALQAGQTFLATNVGGLYLSNVTVFAHGATVSLVNSNAFDPEATAAFQVAGDVAFYGGTLVTSNRAQGDFASFFYFQSPIPGVGATLATNTILLDGITAVGTSDVIYGPTGGGITRPVNLIIRNCRFFSGYDTFNLAFGYKGTNSTVYLLGNSICVTNVNGFTNNGWGPTRGFLASGVVTVYAVGNNIESIGGTAGVTGQDPAQCALGLQARTGAKIYAAGNVMQVTAGDTNAPLWYCADGGALVSAPRDCLEAEGSGVTWRGSYTNNTSAAGLIVGNGIGTNIAAGLSNSSTLYYPDGSVAVAASAQGAVTIQDTNNGNIFASYQRAGTDFITTNQFRWQFDSFAGTGETLIQMNIQDAKNTVQLGNPNAFNDGRHPAGDGTILGQVNIYGDRNRALGGATGSINLFGDVRYAGYIQNLPLNAGETPLTLSAATNQTANLFVIQDSNTVPLLTVSSNGVLTGNGSGLTNLNPINANNVLFYGVTNNGSSTNDSEIAAAIASNSTNSLYWPAGIYNFSSTITIRPGAYWYGDGTNTVLNFVGAYADAGISNLTTDTSVPMYRTVLRDMTLNANITNQLKDGIAMHGIYGVEFENVTVMGFGITNGGFAFYDRSNANTTITSLENCYALQCAGSGVFSIPSLSTNMYGSDVRIHGGRYQGNYGYGIYQPTLPGATPGFLTVRDSCIEGNQMGQIRQDVGWVRISGTSFENSAANTNSLIMCGFGGYVVSSSIEDCSFATSKSAYAVELYNASNVRVSGCSYSGGTNAFIRAENANQCLFQNKTNVGTLFQVPEAVFFGTSNGIVSIGQGGIEVVGGLTTSGQISSSGSDITAGTEGTIRAAYLQYGNGPYLNTAVAGWNLSTRVAGARGLDITGVIGQTADLFRVSSRNTTAGDALKVTAETNVIVRSLQTTTGGITNLSSAPFAGNAGALTNLPHILYEASSTSNATVTVSGGAGVWTLITNQLTATAGLMPGWTIATNAVIWTNTAMAMVHCAVTASFACSSANRNVQLAAYKSGTRIVPSIIRNNLATADVPQSTAMHPTFVISPGEYIQIYGLVEGTGNLTMVDMNMVFMSLK